MNRLKKSIITLVGAGLFFGGAAYKISKGDSYIEKFNECRDNAKNTYVEYVPSPEGMTKVETYDSDGDERIDCGVGYPVFPGEDGRIIRTKYPLSYWLDLNKDNDMNINEVKVDQNADGLNGNEESLELKLEGKKEFI